MAHVIAAGTGAERVVVWLRMESELYPDAASDDNLDAAALAVDGDVMPPLPDADLSIPVIHNGRLLGAMSLRMAQGRVTAPGGATARGGHCVPGWARAGERQADRGSAGLTAAPCRRA
jgi:hypothetical protein